MVVAVNIANSRYEGVLVVVVVVVDDDDGGDGDDKAVDVVVVVVSTTAISVTFFRALSESEKSSAEAADASKLLRGES